MEFQTPSMTAFLTTDEAYTEPTIIGRFEFNSLEVPKKVTNLWCEEIFPSWEIDPQDSALVRSTCRKRKTPCFDRTVVSTMDSSMLRAWGKNRSLDRRIRFLMRCASQNPRIVEELKEMPLPAEIPQPQEQTPPLPTVDFCDWLQNDTEQLFHPFYPSPEEMRERQRMHRNKLAAKRTRTERRKRIKEGLQRKGIRV